MKIDQLTALIEVVKEGSINAASKKLFVSQQSLHYALKSLEDELGTAIYYRIKGGVALTEEGQVVYSAAQAIVARHQHMLDGLEALKNTDHVCDSGLSGELSIHASPMISLSILPIAYMEYMHRYPKVQVFCKDSYQNNIVQAVADRSCDLGYILVGNHAEGFYQSVPEEVQLEHINSFPLYFGMSSNHPLALHQRLSLQAIREYPLVVYEVGGPQGEHALLNSIDMKQDLATDNYKMCCAYLNEGKALLLSFELFILYKVFADFRHVPLQKKEIYFNLYQARHRELSEDKRQLTESFDQIMKQHLHVSRTD